MKKQSNWPYIILALFIFTAIVISAKGQKVSNEKQANVPSLKDTIFLPAAKIPLQALVSLDSITQYLIPEIGRSMSVDESNQYKQFYFRQINRIRNSMLMDSIAVPSQKPNSKQGK